MTENADVREIKLGRGSVVKLMAECQETFGRRLKRSHTTSIIALSRITPGRVRGGGTYEPGRREYMRTQAGTPYAA